MKTCPRCGFAGDISHCPNDGEVLLDPTGLSERAPADPTQAPAPVSREHPQVAAAVAPTLADVSHDDLPAAKHEEIVRDENFGKWAEPEVKKKAGDPMIGRLIAGRYEIISLLGQGGMGAVYKARQPSVKRMIALKILLKEFADNETVVKRFHQEALAASRLTHPNTIKVFDFGQTDDGVLYMAMELLRGESLAHAISRGGPMTPRRVVHIMRQCCKSLAEAHKSGIIHRDLKPDNIFLVDIEGERDFVKVLDFGVAKLKEYEGKEGTLTQAGMIFGTPKYMSPEQARSGTLDQRSDVYALGVIMYEMLMGRPPFSGDNPLSILISHVNEQPRRFQQFNPAIQIPVPLEAVVFKSLNKDRELRQTTVEHLQAELDAVDELLTGASIDTLAGRLPALLPGPEGDPSLVGPAIVPAGQAGTAPARALEKGGTIRLGEDGKPVLEDQSPTTSMAVGEIAVTSELPAPRKSRVGVFVGMAVVAAGAAAAAVVALKPPPPPPAEPIGEPAPVSLAAAGGPATAPSAAMPESAKAPESGGQAGGKSRLCRIFTDPSNVQVFLAANPTSKVGVTVPGGLLLEVAENTKYLLRTRGYKDAEVALDVSAEPCEAHSKLIAEPKAISKTEGKPGGSSPTGGGTVVIGAPTGETSKVEKPAEEPVGRKDITIQ